MEDLASEYAKKTDSIFIGQFNIDLSIPLTLEEKSDLGESQSKLLNECRAIENDLKEYSKIKRLEIDDLYSRIYELASTLSNGFRKVSRPLHCFYDHKEKKRLYVDIATGEVLASREPKPGDEQGRLEGVVVDFAKREAQEPV